MSKPADEKILLNGNGIHHDVGMTGAEDSAIGMKTDIVVKDFFCKHTSVSNRRKRPHAQCGYN